MDGQQERELTVPNGIGSPPYVSYVTFGALLDRLKTEGIPMRFDRSVWESKYSGSTSAQLAASLRFLGLLDGDKPREELELLVESTGEERKQVLARILEHSYSHVPFDHLSRGTPSMVEEWFRQYGVDGNTKRKAKAFFVNACKDADIPLSTLIRKMARNKPPKVAGSVVAKGRRRAKPAMASPKPAVIPSSAPTRINPAGENKEHASRLELASGGSVSLRIDVDLFQLSEEDREFVLGLVDRMKSYGQEGEGHTG